MSIHFAFGNAELARLLQNPRQVLRGTMSGQAYTASIAIPGYATNIQNHYQSLIKPSLHQVCNHACIDFPFTHFGLIIHFDEAAELYVHDKDLSFRSGERELIDKLGAIIIRNAYMDPVKRDQGHRNRFPHLNFHVDRSINQPTPYSCFTRNPFDQEQVEPRNTSTLIAANIIGYLQCLKESKCNAIEEKGVRGTYDLFQNEDMDKVLGNIMLEQSWNLPRGTGEIVLIDNRTVLHASYYRDLAVKGYRIGVRYLK
jgi:hypothetical protein